MKSRRLLFVPLLAGLALAAAHAQPSPLEKTRLARTQIDTLLGPRRSAQPPPADPPNPFTAPGAVAVDPNPANPNPTPTASTEQEILARTLKLGGTATVGGRLQLIVNGVAYKEGDTIVVREDGQIMRVKLLRIVPPSAVFELNDNEVIVRIRN